jgi:ATP/maltotriose-dependent transcriptional regulator MalT
MQQEQVFWYTFRPGLNDDAISVVQALALFLAQPGDVDAVPPDVYPLGPTVARLLAKLPLRPVLLCFDDAHVVDNDPATRSLLEALFPSAHERRLTVLILSRHRPTFTTEPTGPALGGLSQADAAALLHQLNLPPLPPDLFAALYQRTQGNPQLLRLFAAGLSARELSSAAFAASCRKAMAAMSRQRAVYAYLMDNVWHVLSPQEQETLQVLAVCRPPVRYEIIEALLDRPDRDARATLYSLVDHHILEETPDGTELTIHPLVRDFCYGLLAGRDAPRVRLHQRAATAYEDEGEILEAAYHHMAADEWSRAARLLVAHVDVLLETGQASRLVRQLTDFPLGLEPENLSLDDWIAVQIALGQVLAQQGDHDGAVATYDLLLVTLQRQQGAVARRHRAQVYYWLASVYEQQSDYDAALACLQQGIEQAETLEDEPRVLGQLLARTAWVLYRQAEYDQALGYCERGLALLPSEGQDDVVGEAYRILGAIHHARGDLTQAIAYAETALWASRRAGDVAGQVRAHQDLADYYAQRGDYAAGEHAMQVQLLRGRAKLP